MKNLNYLDKYRVPFMGNMGDQHNGAFVFQFKVVKLTVIASDGMGWDHVSVDCETRCPRWDEMCKIKEMFFEDNEVVMQLHPAKENYVNIHENCLHLWRPQKENIPLPLTAMV